MTVRPALCLMTSLFLGSVGIGSAYAANQDVGQSMPGQSNVQQDMIISDVIMESSDDTPNIYSLYFTLKNNGDEPHLLTSVTSPSCPTLIGHHSDQESTPGTINLFTHLPLPAHTTLVFPHGGYHLLCMNTDKPIQVGQDVSVKFSFMGGVTKEVTVKIRKS